MVHCLNQHSTVSSTGRVLIWAQKSLHIIEEYVLLSPNEYSADAHNGLIETMDRYILTTVKTHIRFLRSDTLYFFTNAVLLKSLEL